MHKHQQKQKKRQPSTYRHCQAPRAPDPLMATWPVPSWYGAWAVPQLHGEHNTARSAVLDKALQLPWMCKMHHGGKGGGRRRQISGLTPDPLDAHAHARPYRP